MRSKKSRYAWFALFFLCTAALSCARSCQKSARSQEGPITIAIPTPIEALDARYTSSAVAGRVSKLVYAPLFELDDDASPEPLLAESIEALDEKTFKIKLKKGLTFHDGSPLTSSDVVYTYEELGSRDVASPHAEKFDYVDKIRAAN